MAELAPLMIGEIHLPSQEPTLPHAWHMDVLLGVGREVHGFDEEVVNRPCSYLCNGYVRENASGLHSSLPMQLSTLHVQQVRTCDTLTEP
jgi:hypothetical protein